MRKFLVVLLILSVMGGVFAQENNWTFSGETTARSTWNFIPEDPTIAGSATARLSFTVEYKNAGWELKLPFRFRWGDSTGFDGDGYLKYADGPLAVEFRFDGGNMFSVDWAQVDYKADDYWLQLRVQDIGFYGTSGAFAAGGIDRLRGEYSFDDGTLGVRYDGDGLGYFRTTDINLVSGAWGHFKGVGYKHSLGDISFGLYLDGLFSSTLLVDGLLDIGLGAKYEADSLAASAILEIQPSLTNDDINIGAYLSAQYKIADPSLTFGADASMIFSSGDPLFNFGVDAVYGSRGTDSVGTWARLRFLGTNILADAAQFGLFVDAAYNYRFDRGNNGLDVSDIGASFKEDTGDGLFGTAWFYIPHFDNIDAVYTASTSGMQFGAIAGYNGSLDALSFYGAVRAVGSSTADDLAFVIGLLAGAGYKITDIFTDWDFNVNGDVALTFNTSTETAAFGFRITPAFTWKIRPTSTITFDYTIGADNAGTEFALNTHRVRATFKWTF